MIPLDKDGTWLCDHVAPAAPARLREADKSHVPPHYVICPECGTHWVVYYESSLEKKCAAAVVVPGAYAAIVEEFGDREEES